jgi:CRISPR/Cas system CMR-associated protein Cmr5 small subunit
VPKGKSAIAHAGIIATIYAGWFFASKAMEQFVADYMDPYSEREKNILNHLKSNKIEIDALKKQNKLDQVEAINNTIKNRDLISKPMKIGEKDLQIQEWGAFKTKEKKRSMISLAIAVISSIIGILILRHQGLMDNKGTIIIGSAFALFHAVNLSYGLDKDWEGMQRYSIDN